MAATLATVLLFAALAWPAAPWTISCVGDSITEEGGASSSDDAYPAVLEGLLGSGFEVKNFGRSGATMMEIEGESYRDRDEYEEALESEPDVVTIMLGTNDAKGEFWGTLIDDPEDQYVESYVDLIATFQALDTKPRVVAMIPVPQLEESSKWPDSDVINEASRDSCFVIPAREFNYFLQILPDLVADVAAQSNIDVIDMRVPFGDPPDEDYYKDGIHPNDDGNEAMAAHLSTELSRLGLLAPATYAPTYAPTPRPVRQPTPRPVFPPSPRPTAEPTTYGPTPAPTPRPVLPQSSRPTVEPSIRPTIPLTSSPTTATPTTYAPTYAPTSTPPSRKPTLWETTLRPTTLQPTYNPSPYAPSSKPLPATTSAPTPKPTPKPTSEPTPEPSQIPPSPKPTLRPSPKSSPPPSPKPTLRPSPKSSPPPSPKPTPHPLPEPSPSPVPSPSRKSMPPPPSQTPTPSPNPTPSPSSRPTPMPSLTPASSPSPKLSMPTTLAPSYPVDPPSAAPTTVNFFFSFGSGGQFENPTLSSSSSSKSGDKNNDNEIVAIVLGATFAFLVLLIALSFAVAMLRRRQQRKYSEFKDSEAIRIEAALDKKAAASAVVNDKEPGGDAQPTSSSDAKPKSGPVHDDNEESKLPIDDPRSWTDDIMLVRCNAE